MTDEEIARALYERSQEWATEPDHHSPYIDERGGMDRVLIDGEVNLTKLVCLVRDIMGAGTQKGRRHPEG